MNVLSLFSGIGGLDLGLERAGMTVVGQVEIDPWCRKVLAKHWPEVPRHDDVRTCAEWWGDRPAPDVIAGGFPCQPVSVAGKRLAQADERWLWPAFADTIRALRPRFALMENVPGLLAAGMGDVLGDLAACGYDAEWDCVPASAVGAPHRRDRVWIIAYPQRGQLRDQPGRGGGEGRPGPAVPGDDGAAWALADAGGAPGRLRPGRWKQQPQGSEVSGHVADTDGSRLRTNLGDLSARQPDAAGRGPMADTERDRLEGPEHQGAGQGAAAGGRRPAEPGSARVVADTGRIGRREGSRQLGWLGPAQRGWWVTEPDVGRVAHGIPRRVDRLRGLGNAVVPQVAEHIGRLIMTAAVAS